MIETRGAEACYAMALLYRETGDSRYLACARAMVEFLLRSQAASGWWTNDGTSIWRGITVFQTMALQETYLLLKEIDPPLCKRIEPSIAKAIGFLVTAFKPGQANINYRLALCPVLWTAAEVLGRSELRQRAASYADSFFSNVNEDELLKGEGDGRASVDVGYNVGMSLGALAIYALKAADTRLLDKILQSARAHLVFIYPDGSLDNSWGSRSYKWTMLDGKTVHGPAMTYLLLAHLDSAFLLALNRHLDYLEQRLRNGIIGTGPHCYKNPHYRHACAHPTFSHACGLASGLMYNRLLGALPPVDQGRLPCDETPWSRQFRSVNVVLHRSKRMMATLSGSAHSWSKDRFHPTIPSGGGVSYLWGAGYGPIQVGSQQNYQRVEPANMPESFDKPGNLTPRVDYHSRNGTLFSSAFERDTRITLQNDFRSLSEGRLKSLEGVECGIAYKILYEFCDSGVKKIYELIGRWESWVFIREPVIFDPDWSVLQRLENGLVVIGPHGKIRITSSHAIHCSGSERNSLLWCPFPSVYGLDLRINYGGDRVWIDITLEE
jgi:hypothetical protein